MSTRMAFLACLLVCCGEDPRPNYCALPLSEACTSLGCATCCASYRKLDGDCDGRRDGDPLVSAYRCENVVVMGSDVPAGGAFYFDARSGDLLARKTWPDFACGLTGSHIYGAVPAFDPATCERVDGMRERLPGDCSQ